MYDFVVVGVGPAGARFSRRAARRGHDVLALEQGTVGTPLACSGHVSTDVWAFTGDGARDELLQNEIYGARFHVGGPNSEAYPFYKDEVASNVVDRVGLDRHLAALAREAGVDVREAHTVTDVREHHDRVEVVASGPDETHTFEAKLVAGCDGPRSKVRAELGLPEPGELLHGVLAFSEEEDHQDFVDVHLTAPTFFAWRIPRGDAGVEYGLAAPPGVQVNKHFEELIDGYEIDVARRCSGAIPIGPPNRVTSRRGFLIGDAAGQTKPFTGGGILYGMTSADHAARKIDPDWPSTLEAYERAWRDDLERDQFLGQWIRRAYSLPEPVQRIGLRVLSGEIGVHMDRPTSLVSPRHLRAMASRLWR
ncbi:geranylgeranyl reductase family protein [Natronobacterium gregoryi]|uniref:Electron transfer flavoprotein n=2 Tax=Natronobacterium gregoryi TaxID=44930 RepID=L0AJ67_NATGS|nr:geranylgeranyl reductase family protein [Natronobacterium gregoryi]AFZ73494.1 geranylgeranyl reductase family protein [Natronobacterium gregoryi SP2]ELY68347.1 geranylgeranyl reductase [Natronobacterium gregoryi SP2]PLK20493.1 electron transfer flavoprotein [Natronobacterium gregoryi SP2]SFI70734.1 geranylgeranyl reductase family [Natronobacterium gregoryi]